MKTVTEGWGDSPGVLVLTKQASPETYIKVWCM